VVRVYVVKWNLGDKSIGFGWSLYVNRDLVAWHADVDGGLALHSDRPIIPIGNDGTLAMTGMTAARARKADKKSFIVSWFVVLEKSSR
jgi:hypothetical protein